MEEMIEDTLEAIEPEELEEQAAVSLFKLSSIFNLILGRSRKGLVGDHRWRTWQGPIRC